MPPRMPTDAVRPRANNRLASSVAVVDPDSDPEPGPARRLLPARHFDGLSRSLVATPSRRAALQMAASAALAAIAGWQSSDDVEARSYKKKCRKLTRKSARRRCLRRAKAKHRTRKNTQGVTSPPNASCLAAWDDAMNLNNTFLAAQTFTAPDSGILIQVRLLFSRQDVPDSTFFRLTLNVVDQHTGRPTHAVIAEAFVPATEVSNRAQWPTMVTFGYGNLPLIAGEQYALVLFQSAPDEDASHFIYFATGGQCSGGGVYTAGMTTPFAPLDPAMQMIYETIVAP